MTQDMQQELSNIELYMEPQEEPENHQSEPLRTVDDVLAYYASRK
ncbi:MULTISPECIES: hypothetical protein [Paenibacillus]|nr:MULTISPECIES: hypothetical protein [Paenibacillus]GIP21395.1 hypothetical protein J22TS3_16700 [Paenibacillus sp. J22TS3]